jgi:prolyl-tRNA editing enzyme YbaK/EbsC (Cys-tRNA(Pro) deacylase)
VRQPPEAVERVARFLLEAKVEARLEEFLAGTPTAEDAAAAAGCRLGQIVKSLVFLCDGQPVLVMVPGDRRADRAKVARALGCGRTVVAPPQRVADETGFEAGGVAPFPLPRIQRCLIDPTLLVHDEVWVGAGSSRHMAVLAPADLARLTCARSVDVVEQSGNVRDGTPTKES